MSGLTLFSVQKTDTCVAFQTVLKAVMLWMSTVNIRKDASKPYLILKSNDL